MNFQFQPTLPVRGVTATETANAAAGVISTHTPRAGSDFHLERLHAHFHISTHTPRAGSDGEHRKCRPYVIPFQPTLPVRGVTKSEFLLVVTILFQPTLPVRGVTYILRSIS